MPPRLRLRLRLRQPIPLSLLNRLLRYPPPTRLLPLASVRSVHVRFFPVMETSPQLIPPVDIRMLLPFLVSKGGNWTLSRDGFAIQRGLQFDTFKETHNFIYAVCTHAQHLGHHPEWSNIYKEIFIRLTTHKDRDTGARGISALDLGFARFCDTHIKKGKGTSNTGLSLGARGKVLLMEVGQHKEMAGENGALNSKEFRESPTREYINLREREEETQRATQSTRNEASAPPSTVENGGKGQEDWSDRIRADGKDEQKHERVQKQTDEALEEARNKKAPSPEHEHEPATESEEQKELRTLQPARKTRPSTEPSDYEVWTSWKKKTQATYQRRTSWAALLKEASGLGIPRSWASRQIHEIVSVYEKENASSSPSPATSAYEKENASSSPSPVTSSDSTQESHSDQLHPRKSWRYDVSRVIMTKEVIEAQEAWLHTVRMETLVYETPIEELHAKAMDQGIDPAWAWEQLANLAGVEGSADSPEPPKDIPHPDRPTRKTRADRIKARPAASIDSPSRDNAVSAAFFPSQPELSSILDVASHRTPEPLSRQKTSKKRAKQAKAITALSSSPSLSFPSPSRSPTDDDTEAAPPRALTPREILQGTNPNSKRFFQKVKREIEQEAKRRKDKEKDRLRVDRLKANRRAQATSWEAAPTAALRPQHSPREPTLGLARYYAPRSTRPHDGDTERRSRESTQRWSKGGPMGDWNVRGNQGQMRAKGRRGRTWSARRRS